MIRVLLADDHPFVRRGVRETLTEAGGIEVVAEAEDGAEALELVRAREIGIDVVVADISMPRLDGLELLDLLHAELPSLPVLVLSTHPSRELGIQVLQAGARGYVEKRDAPERLVGAVRRVAAGGRVVGPELADELASQLMEGGPPRLSVREVEVVRAIAQGQTRSQIAASLSLSSSAVSTYRRRALAKLQLDTDAQLGRYALVHGLVE